MTVTRARSKRQSIAEKKPLITIINKSQNNDDKGQAESKEKKIFEDVVPILSVTDKKSLNQSLASKSSGSKFIDEVEDYMEITELTNFDDITFDSTQMTAIIDKEENITFHQDPLSNDSQRKYSTSENEDSCTFKLEYPTSEHNTVNTSDDSSEQRQFACRHCGKQYRWKSTLRRHENVECGGKAPSYECPYCDYKAKQRGNLGVHVRKHHSDMPQLETKRKRGSNR